jgi:hypothetical protein
MPQVKSIKSLKEICFHSILENPDFFCKRFSTLEELLEDGENALDSDSVNPINQLRKLSKLSKDFMTFKLFLKISCCTTGGADQYFQGKENLRRILGNKRSD